MTREQSQWVATMKVMATQKPARTAKVPTGVLRRRAFELVNSEGWEVFIMGFVIAVVGVMACDFWGIKQHDTANGLYERALDVSAYFFYCECAMKIFALGVGGYWGTARGF